jgi:hypothetical protein
MTLTIRRHLLWNYDVPPDPEHDEAFLALYVGRVLDRGTAEDVRTLGLDLVRRFLDVAPARREVIEFWRWYLEQEGSHDDPNRSPAHVPAHRGIGGDPPA